MNETQEKRINADDESIDVVDFAITKSTIGLNVHTKPLNTPINKSSTIDRRSNAIQFIQKRCDSTNSVKEFIRDRPKLVKRSSIAKLFGNTYSTQQQQQQILSPDDRKSTTNINAKWQMAAAAIKTEKFKKCTETQIEQQTNDYKNGNDSLSKMNKMVSDEKDISGRALRTLSKSIGKLWRRSHSVEISTPDPEYKVLYLGNVLTGWAKGDSCVEKPLATLWRNYTQNNKPDVVMRFLVCSSGLKATTRQHGLTEYWSNRITYCCSPKNYPRIFCWIYRHEGRKLKHELRCHAILCAKESIAEQICQTLKENIARALQEFKRDKINRQNARLSLANSVYDNPSMPRRKILLSIGANNYRPPMERSKSAPKLMAIEEAIGEEDEDDAEIELPSNRPSCCKEDPLFPAMTLGRKHCRRGHSIRRTKHGCNSLTGRKTLTTTNNRIRSVSFDENIIESKHYENNAIIINQKLNERMTNDSKSGDDEEDEFNNLLMVNDYDGQSSLSGELLSYFDTKLKLKSASSMSELCSNTQQNDDDNENEMFDERVTMSLDNLNQYSDEDEERSNQFYENETDRIDTIPNTFYNQDDIIDCLVNVSMQTNTKCNLEANDEKLLNSTSLRTALKSVNGTISLDSDEGSISSGCETSSNVTTTNFDEFLRKDDKNDLNLNLMANEDDYNSEVSDESGFDEIHNFIAKTMNGLTNDTLIRHVNECDNSINSKKIGINDDNNNNTIIKQNKCDTSISNCQFLNETTTTTSTTAQKGVNRLMINIPKNAKSILI